MIVYISILDNAGDNHNMTEKNSFNKTCFTANQI